MKMTIQEAVKILEEYQKWRKGDETIEQLPPKLISETIETILTYLKNVLKK